MRWAPLSFRPAAPAGGGRDSHASWAGEEAKGLRRPPPLSRERLPEAALPSHPDTRPTPPPRGPRPARGRRRPPRPRVWGRGKAASAAPPLSRRPKRRRHLPSPSHPLASHPFAAEQEPRPERRRGPSKPRGSGMARGDATRPPEARLGGPGAPLGREHTSPSRRRRAPRGHVTRPFRQRPDLHRAATP